MGKMSNQLWQDSLHYRRKEGRSELVTDDKG